MLAGHCPKPSPCFLCLCVHKVLLVLIPRASDGDILCSSGHKDANDTPLCCYETQWDGGPLQKKSKKLLRLVNI